MRAGAREKMGIGGKGAKYGWRSLVAKVTRGRCIRWSWFPSAHLSDNAAIQRDRAYFLKTEDAAEDPKVDIIWH